MNKWRIFIVGQLLFLSPFAAPTDAFGGTSTSVPTAPEISLVTRGVDSLAIAFVSGSSKNATQYQYSLDDGTSWKYGTRRGNSIVVSKVDPATRYQIQLRGVNSKGAGPASTSYGTKLALFVGASITAGSGGSGNGWANQVGSRFKWQVANVAKGNSGYGLPANNSSRCTGKINFISQLNCGLAFQPDIIFISGGLNDCRTKKSLLGSTTSQVVKTFQFAHERFQGAVVIGTPTITFATGNCLNELNNKIALAANEYSVNFVAGAQNWLPGKTYRNSDGVHPNIYGHSYIARRVIAWLAQKRLTLS